MYAATNQAFTSDAFDEASELNEAQIDTKQAMADLVAAIDSSARNDDIVDDEAQGDNRESWDNKLMFLLATIG